MDDNKIKLNLSEIESLDESGMNIPVNEDLVTKDVPAQVAEQTQQPVCIIDETSTTVTFGEETNVPLHEILPTAPSSVQPARAQNPQAQAVKPQIKEKIKFSVVQIVLIAVVGLVALWTIFFTVDHTLAANGRSPIFCKQTQVFEDNSTSYKGLFYKVQFKFDSNGNLTQKVCPSWKDGPNDVVAENN